MSIAIIFVLLVINFAISIWNARVVGLCWDQLKEMGPVQQLIGWAGAVQSASGFSWCYTLVLLILGFYVQPAPQEGHDPYLTLDMVQSGLALGYIIIVPGVILSGIVIWLHSVVEAWRRRDAASIGVAAWNTMANASNIYHAAKDMPSAWGSASKLFKGEKDKNWVVIALVALALFGGIFTTMGIVDYYRGEARLREKLRA